MKRRECLPLGGGRGGRKDLFPAFTGLTLKRGIIFFFSKEEKGDTPVREKGCPYG